MLLKLRCAIINRFSFFLFFGVSDLKIEVGEDVKRVDIRPGSNGAPTLFPK